MGAIFCGSVAFGAEGGGPGATFINYHEIILHFLGFEDHDLVAVAGAILTLVILVLIGVSYRGSATASLKNYEKGDAAALAPDGRVSVGTIVETFLDLVSDLASDVIGKDGYKPFLPLLCSLFLFILYSNLCGLLPGFPPATESINTNLAMALSVFVVYNYAGIKEHGFSYVKQFLGPVWWLAPLLFCIEVVSHLARPLSLSLRLYGNIFGDHLVLSVFTGLSYVFLPALLLFFGLLVALLQSFVFTLLTSIYISMAVSHDH